MDPYRIVEIKEDICSRNNEHAAVLRDNLKARHVLYINIMASPGSGKTTLLTHLINDLKDKYRIGVIEADIDGAEDAKTISEATGTKTLQMHTGGACHITWQMSKEALDALGVDDLDVVFLENVGNLVCPAEFDTGAAVNLVLLSVPEGDDKPLKYPLMFERASCVAITKTDTLPAFEDFSKERVERNVHERAPEVPVFYTCGMTGEGIQDVAAYIQQQAQQVCAAQV